MNGYLSGVAIIAGIYMGIAALIAAVYTVGVILGHRPKKQTKDKHPRRRG